MNYIKKSDIKNNIAEAQARIVMQADIETVIKELCHYKQVNKRFTDRLKSMGYHSYIGEKYGYKALRVSQNVGCTQFRIELTFYEGEFTWDGILNQLKKYNYKESAEYWTKRLESFDDDYKILGCLMEVVKSHSTANFDTYRLTHMIEDCLSRSKEKE